MGNFCCMDNPHHSEQGPGPQNEWEALLNSANSCNACVEEQPTSPQKYISNKHPIDLQNKIGIEDVNNGAVPTKSFHPQSSIAIGADFGADLESEEYDTNILQLKSDEQVCAVQSTAVASELNAAPVFKRIEDHYSNSETQDDVNFFLQASSESGPDLEIVQDEKYDSPSNAQQVESEKRTVKVQGTNVTWELKLEPDVNGIANVEDKQAGSNTRESMSCNTSEKPEEEKCAHIEAVWKTMQNDKSNEVADAVSQECTSDLLTESAVGSHCSNMENSMNTAKRARLSQGSDGSICGHEGEHEQTEVVLHEVEEGTKKFQNKQSDHEMEEMKNCQSSVEPIHTSVQGTELAFEETHSPELKENLANNEKSTCEKSVVKETPENIKNCNEECIDGEEDLYRDEVEIEKEKFQRLISQSQLAERSTIEPGVAILEYCTREWKGNTAKAQLMKKLPEKLIAAKYTWIKQWYFGVQDCGSKDPVKKLKEYLAVLKQKWTQICEMDSLEERQVVCEEVFKNDQEEYRLYEAMKILMLAKAIELDYDKVQKKEIPLFCWLLFARDTSTDPYQFMKNHLNHVGYTGGLDQVEMFLLGYSLELTIRVFRLYKFGTDEFVTFYPDDHKEDWPMVTLITEDDRHYNVPVEDAQVTDIS
ncbi:uncharacterized protein LOC121275822 isoform X2 [Carcharodon carcharias]|uniref:uncharacterized protein LOC121275822 isoform X2 n=1 Tax=Carcharodon carcharias TaxID=13397 RepID=UPI001B7F0D7F|nr:uncharacterized protein LOC121275822 isoform X2 [Carcharodon carcharias]